MSPDDFDASDSATTYPREPRECRHCARVFQARADLTDDLACSACAHELWQDGVIATKTDAVRKLRVAAAAASQVVDVVKFPLVHEMLAAALRDSEEAAK